MKEPPSALLLYDKNLSPQCDPYLLPEFPIDQFLFGMYLD